MQTDIAAKIPQYVHTVLEVLRRGGKHGYLVGGSLRDILRGVTPHDFDLTTDATPDEMCEIFADFRVIPTGLRHGTVTVLSEGHPVEITAHRTDGTYTDSRHPDGVAFTADLFTDLARRDFTVNAMAWSKETGLVDRFGGQADLAAGILRAVGDPETRFREDALRILRCFRFSAQLDFNVDPATAKGAAATVTGLANISVERIFDELTRTLSAAAAEKGLRGMLTAGAFPYVFYDCPPDVTVFPLLQALPPEAALRMAALLHRAPTDSLRALMRRWHTSNTFAGGVLAYTAALTQSTPQTPYEARRFVCRHYPHFEGGLLLRAALFGEDTAAALALCRKVLRDGTAVELRRLATNGKELQEELGILPQKTAAMLARLQDAVWQEPAKNRREALLNEARLISQKEDFC